jgi:beta-fructofuranosidase
MAFKLEDRWVWDFWLADDGKHFHLYYLFAPRSLGDPELRHRNARIGHATSPDLRTWQDHGVVIEPGANGDFDETATWTGSVVQGADNIWRMFYTGSKFLYANSTENIESVGMAQSLDLFNWEKVPEVRVSAAPEWYETFGMSGWPEEAWRDPWVYPAPDGPGWHMLVTARSNTGELDGRGVVGHATSPDLENWNVEPPFSQPEAGFAHIEVPQVVEIDGKAVLIFCCDAKRLSGKHAGKTGGIWAAPADSMLGPFRIEDAYLLAEEPLYAGRLARDRAGEWVLMGFLSGAKGQPFSGFISDPIPLVWNGPRNRLEVAMIETVK